MRFFEYDITNWRAVQMEGRELKTGSGASWQRPPTLQQWWQWMKNLYVKSGGADSCNAQVLSDYSKEGKDKVILLATLLSKTDKKNTDMGGDTARNS